MKGIIKDKRKNNLMFKTSNLVNISQPFMIKDRRIKDN